MGAYAGVFLVALTTRLLHVWSMQGSAYFHTLMGDSRSYDRWALEIAAGNWNGGDVFYQAPLYPYFLGTIYDLVGRNLFVVRLVQSALGAAACACLAWAGERLFSRAVGITAGLVLALYAPAVFFDGLIQKATLDLFFVCVVVAIAARLVARDDAKPLAPWARAATWLCLGAGAGLLSLTRENALVLVPVLAAWPLVRAPRTAARQGTQAALVVVGAFAVLAPVAVRNWSIGGELFLTTSQFGPNFYIGNNPRADGTYAPLRFGRGSPEHERADATQLAERAVGRTLTPAEVSGYWAGRAFTFIREQPLDWTTLMARKAMLIVNADEMLDTEGLESHAESSWPLRVLSPLTHFGVLVPLAVLGLCLTWGDRSRLIVLYTVGAALALTTVAFYVFARYRHALAPFVVLFASAGLVRGWTALAETRGEDAWGARVPRAWPIAAAVILAAVASNWPLLSPSLMRAISATNLGTALFEDGRPQDAAAHYRHALTVQPDYAPAFNNLGVVLRAQGRLDEAIDAYRAGLRARPDYPDLHYNLGNALVEKKAPGEAAEHLQIAAATLPDSAAARNNLGQALAARGRLDAAETELRRAVELDPRSATARRNLGNVLASQGRVQDADTELRRALALNGESGEAWYDLGSLLLEAGRAADAVDALTRAVRLDPDSAQAHNNLGIALAQQGRVNDAVAAFERALELQPGFADARRNLAMARGLGPAGRSLKAPPTPERAGQRRVQLQ